MDAELIVFVLVAAGFVLWIQICKHWASCHECNGDNERWARMEASIKKQRETRAEKGLK